MKTGRWLTNKPYSCCIAASIRIYYLYQSNHNVLRGRNENQYRYATGGFIWAHIEPNCSIVAACLPTYGPLFKDNQTFLGWWTSLRSFISSGSQSSSGYRARGQASGKEHDGIVSESALALDRRHKGHWQKLDKSDTAVSDPNNTVIITGETRSKDHDLEAQHSEGITIARGFGTEP